MGQPSSFDRRRRSRPSIKSPQGRSSRDTLSRPSLSPWRAWASQACSEVPGGVHPPRGARGEYADDEREPLIPTPAYPLTAARFPAFARLPESTERTGEAERCDVCPDHLLFAHDHANLGSS